MELQSYNASAESVFDLVDHGLGDHAHRAAKFLLGAVVGKVDGLLF
ncbi:MAG: hypothetical protein ABR988_01665 [Terriglobales bacterium]|jgi:hypothetical protein